MIWPHWHNLTSIVLFPGVVPCCTIPFIITAGIKALELRYVYSEMQWPTTAAMVSFVLTWILRVTSSASAVAAPVRMPFTKSSSEEHSALYREGRSWTGRANINQVRRVSTRASCSLSFLWICSLHLEAVLSVVQHLLCCHHISLDLRMAAAVQNLKAVLQLPTQTLNHLNDKQLLNIKNDHIFIAWWKQVSSMILWGLEQNQIKFSQMNSHSFLLFT